MKPLARRTASSLEHVSRSLMKASSRKDQALWISLDRKYRLIARRLPEGTRVYVGVPDTHDQTSGSATPIPLPGSGKRPGGCHPLVFSAAFRACIRCKASMIRSAVSSTLNLDRLRIRS